jgi:hypothetical protein
VFVSWAGLSWAELSADVEASRILWRWSLPNEHRTCSGVTSCMFHSTTSRHTANFIQPPTLQPNWIKFHSISRWDVHHIQVERRLQYGNPSRLGTLSRSGLRRERRLRQGRRRRRRRRREKFVFKSSQYVYCLESHRINFFLIFWSLIINYSIRLWDLTFKPTLLLLLLLSLPLLPLERWGVCLDPYSKAPITS